MGKEDIHNAQSEPKKKEDVGGGSHTVVWLMMLVCWDGLPSERDGHVSVTERLWKEEIRKKQN